MYDENSLQEQVNSLKAQLATLKDQIEPVKRRVQEFKTNFGVKERPNGELIIDFEKMVRNLGIEQCLELRRVIDEVWSVSGAAGEKPKVKVRAAAA